MPELESRAELCITENLDTALAALADGKKTVFLPRETAESIPGFYCTDFWCYPMFRDICNWMKSRWQWEPWGFAFRTTIRRWQSSPPRNTARPSGTTL